MLLTGPIGRLADDVRELCQWLAAGELPLTGRGELHLDDLRRVYERLPGGGPLGEDPARLALARRRVALLQALCRAGRLTKEVGGCLQLTPDGREFLTLPPEAQTGFVFAAWWEGVDWGRWSPRGALGRLLRRERDVLLQELAALPPGMDVEVASLVRRFRRLVAHRWPTVSELACPAVWRVEVWATALAPLALLGVVEVDGPVTAEPPTWLRLSGEAHGLLEAAASLAGPPPAPGLAAAAAAN